MAAVALTALAVLSGCGVGPGGPIRPALPPQSGPVDCPGAMPELRDAATPAPMPAEQPLPAGVAPVDVVQCTSATVDGADGRWLVAVATHYGGDYAALLAALAAPDDVPSAGQACSAIGYLVPPLWLVAADGAAILVHHPREACGAPKHDVDDALAALAVTTTETTPIRLLVPKAAVDTGCDAGWKYLPPSPRDDGTVSAVATDEPAKACVYTAGADLGDGIREGTFARGRVLTAAEAAIAWTDAASAPAAAACEATPTAFGILADAGTTAGSAFYWIELDGCRRVYAQDGPARQATPALLALFG